MPAMLMRMSICLVLLSACASAPSGRSEQGRSPYPMSRYVRQVTWDFSAVAAHRRAHGSDLWPCTWAADRNLYCAWGDGGGFDGDDDHIGRVSLGFARIEGVPTATGAGAFRGKNVWGDAPKYAEAAATFGGKVGSMISVRGKLYAYGALWTEADVAKPTLKSGAGPVHRLIWSEDLGRTWQIAPWENQHVSWFLNFGPDNAGAPDGLVYIYYRRPDEAANVYLARVAPEQLTADPRTSSAYQYLTGADRRGRPGRWSASESDARAVFSDPAGAEVAVVYDAPLRRYLMTAAHNPGGQELTASAGQVALFEGVHPWGPWKTIGYYDHWGNLGPESYGDYLGLVLPVKWISADGRTVWGIFSSMGQYDSFNLVKMTLSTSWWAR